MLKYSKNKYTPMIINTNITNYYHLVLRCFKQETFSNKKPCNIYCYIVFLSALKLSVGCQEGHLTLNCHSSLIAIALLE